MTGAPQDHVIIMPVHNRREVTLAALEYLADDGVFQWATILVVDDGSTDGSGDAVAAQFSQAVVLRGDGTWWWCGAIRRGMEWALGRGAQWIYWLNDDCRPPGGGLRRLRDFAAREACAAWLDAQTPGGWTYGGQRRTAWGIRRCRPEEEVRGEIDTFSGNCVCLSRRMVEAAGLPHDHLFPHGIGDLDYGLRLKSTGAVLRALPGAIATNADPSAQAIESWLGSSRPMREIWRDFRSPRSFLYFPAWRRFALRHWGGIWGCVVFVLPYARWIAIALLRTIAPEAARSLARRRALSSPSGREKFRD